jgi:hypothetical protein
MAFPVTHKRGRLHLGNPRTAQVHVVTRARARCGVDELIAADHAVGFYPDSLAQARREGYDVCVHCTGKSGDR